ncbi:1-deoxy-D-xylulose-5-phosphate synthase [candidate division WOR-3 bacterium]|nr:1-deoxy-D-xylulose-5-phosphate synthase [candidate division WOR-3 bacterium]
MKLLDSINSPQDLKKLKVKQLGKLAAEIRGKILEVTSKTGGHVAPNLGAVELTIALHYVFDAPRDKIIWDVGHQCYTHKLLTSRRKRFATLRQYKGISGFPRRSESEYDEFGTGHAGTSVSAALGLAKAREIKNEDFSVVAVIGDGSVISGMALEAINHVGDAQTTNLMVVLNDNAQSIGKSTGALSGYLARITARFTSTGFYQKLRARVWNIIGRFFKRSQQWIGWARRLERGIKGILTPGGLFEDMGFHYFGPVDGHNIKELISFLKRVKEIPGPVLVHVVTEKGHGFKGATDDPEVFHGIGPFDLISCAVSTSGKRSYSDFFGSSLSELAEADERIVAITAGMTLGTGLTGFSQRFPERFFDFGITEEHCATFAAGLSLQGMRPVFAVYSTFLQRGFDQVIHDIALQKLPVVFAIDRGGLVGADGATHHGAFDLSYLRMIPNFVLAAPKDEAELRDLLYTAVDYEEGPFAFRYPRSGIVGVDVPKKPEKIPVGSWEVLKKGSRVAVLAVGSCVQMALMALDELGGKRPTVVNARFIKPLDEGLLDRLIRNHHALVTVEENALAGGFGSAVIEFLEDKGGLIKVKRIGLPDRFIEHGPQARLLEECGVSAGGIAEAVKKMWKVR